MTSFPDRHVEANAQPSHGDNEALTDSARYSYYFAREDARPASITRLISRRAAMQLSLCRNGRSVQSFLEIGPGEGFMADACRAAGIANYRAVESTSHGVMMLRDKGYDCIQATVPPLPELRDSWDIVFASHLIEHLPTPDAVRELLHSAAEALSDTGAVVVAFPNALRMGMEFFDADYTHTWPSTSRRVHHAARDAGLRVVAEHACCLHLSGLRGQALYYATRLLPLRTAAKIVPSRREFFLRGRMLFAPDILVVMEPIR